MWWVPNWNLWLRARATNHSLPTHRFVVCATSDIISIVICHTDVRLNVRLILMWIVAVRILRSFVRSWGKHSIRLASNWQLLFTRMLWSNLTAWRHHLEMTQTREWLIQHYHRFVISGVFKIHVHTGLKTKIFTVLLVNGIPCILKDKFGL